MTALLTADVSGSFSRRMKFPFRVAPPGVVRQTSCLLALQVVLLSYLGFLIKWVCRVTVAFNTKRTKGMKHGLHLRASEPWGLALMKKPIQIAASV